MLTKGKDENGFQKMCKYKARILISTALYNKTLYISLVKATSTFCIAKLVT